MIKVTIPGYSKAAYAQPLVRAIRAGANQAGVPVHVSAAVMSGFFTQLSEEVAEGRVFRVPGLGVFGGRVCTHKRDGQKFPAPVFVAGTAFRNDLLRTCELDKDDNVVVPRCFYESQEAMRVFRKNHPSRPQPRNRTHRMKAVMDNIRETVMADARRRRAV